jgi:hypothetical protein
MRVLLVATVVASLAAAADERPVRIVDYRNDKVTLVLDHAPLAEVVAEIGRKSGAEVRGSVREAREVTGQFDAVPLREALERLIGAQNFTLTYGDDGKLRTIDLRGEVEEIRPPKEPTTATTLFAYPEPATWITLFKTIENRGRVPVSGWLATVVGDSSCNWDMLLNTAYGHDDPFTRSEAVRAGLKALEADADLRDAILAATGAMSDSDLAEVTRHICKHRSADFLKRIARETDRADIRARAVGVLRQVRAQERAARAAR